MPPSREQRPCQNKTRCCSRHFWNRGIWRFLFPVVCEDPVLPVIRGRGWCFTDADCRPAAFWPNTASFGHCRGGGGGVLIENMRRSNVRTGPNDQGPCGPSKRAPYPGVWRQLVGTASHPDGPATPTAPSRPKRMPTAMVFRTWKATTGKTQPQGVFRVIKNQRGVGGLYPTPPRPK